MEQLEKKSIRGGRRQGAGRPKKYSTNRRHTIFCDDIQYCQLKVLLGKLRSLQLAYQELFDSTIDGSVFQAKKAEIEKITVGELITDGKKLWEEHRNKDEMN